jgi:monofunctional biosynthetic peptidoglycan transglycosylase
MSPDEEEPEEQAPQQPPPAEEPPQEEPLLGEELSSFASEPAPEEHAEAMAEPPIEEPPPEPVQELPPEPPPMQHTPPPLHERPRRADFGDAEIPMPHTMRREDKRRARDARANLDLDLGRIKRRKRYGLFLTTLAVLFIAFVLAPVTWVGLYLFIDPPATTLMLQRAAEGEDISYHPVRVNRISPHVVRSVIAAEDANFCTHDGFDVEAIQDAMQSNARGGRVRGASTISQQVAKNVFLWPERSWLRKGFETYFTSLIEFMWPKRRIMEVYLNVAEWGDGNFGIEAAARARFGVAAADLTPLQAARLAAVLPSPNRWRADSPGPYVRRRSASIVQRARVVRNEHMSGCVLMLDRPSG